MVLHVDVDLLYIQTYMCIALKGAAKDLKNDTRFRLRLVSKSPPGPAMRRMWRLTWL